MAIVLSQFLKDNHIIFNEAIFYNDSLILNILTELFINNNETNPDIVANNLEFYKILYTHYIKKDYKVAQKEYKKFNNIITTYYYLTDLKLAQGKKEKALKYGLEGYYKGKEEYNNCVNDTYQSIGYNTFYIFLYNELIFKIANIYYELKLYTDSKIYLYEYNYYYKTYLLLGNIYKYEKDFTSAVSFYKLGAINTIDKNMAEQCKYELGSHYFNTNKHIKAKKWLKQVKHIKDTLYILAQIYESADSLKCNFYYTEALDKGINVDSCISKLMSALLARKEDNLIIEFLTIYMITSEKAASLLYNYYKFDKKKEDIYEYFEVVNLLVFKYKNITMINNILVNNNTYFKFINKENGKYYGPFLDVCREIIDNYTNNIAIYNNDFKQIIKSIIYHYYVKVQAFEVNPNTQQKLEYLILASNIITINSDIELDANICCAIVLCNIILGKHSEAIKLIQLYSFSYGKMRPVLYYNMGVCYITLKNKNLGIKYIKYAAKKNFALAKEYLRDNGKWWQKI